MKRILVLLALALLGAEGYRVHRSEARHDEEVARLRADLDELRALTGESHQLAALPAALARPAMVAAVPTATAPASGAPAGEGPEAQPIPTIEESVATLVATYEAQSADPTWSRASETSIQGAVSAILPPRSELRSLSCRASMCRMETRHSDQATADRFDDLAAMGTEMIWRGGMYFRHEVAADGSVTTVTYLAREGTSLPI